METGPMRRGVQALVAMLIAISTGGAFATVRAQAFPSATKRAYSGLAGAVRDSLGHPVRLANVLVDRSRLAAVTDDSGHFDLRGLPPGRNGFTITKIGYAPVSFETSLPADSVVVIAILMHAVQVMNTVNVTAERVTAYLARTGFLERRRLGLGKFIAPGQIDSMAPGISTPAEFFRTVPGIDVRCQLSSCVVRSRWQPGCLWLFVDGVPHGTEQIDSLGISPGGVAAIEVYDRPSIVPIEFQGSPPPKQGRGMSTGSGCGAIAVWTKSRVP
jgi:carboxypeptidase family protein